MNSRTRPRHSGIRVLSNYAEKELKPTNLHTHTPRAIVLVHASRQRPRVVAVNALGRLEGQLLQLQFRNLRRQTTQTTRVEFIDVISRRLFSRAC